MEENLYLAEEKAKPKWFKYVVIVLVFFLVLFGVGSFLFLNPPSRFPVNKTFTIEKGHTLKTVALNLKKEKIIKSAVAFQTISILVGDETSIKAGDYLFEKPIGLFDVARRILIGESGINSNKITIPEGVTNREISNILAKNFGNSTKAAKFDKIVKVKTSRP